VAVFHRRSKRAVREAAAHGGCGLLAQVGRAERVLLEQQAHDDFVVVEHRVAERGGVALEQKLGVAPGLSQPRLDALHVAAADGVSQRAVLRRLGRRVRVGLGRNQWLGPRLRVRVHGEILIFVGFVDSKDSPEPLSPLGSLFTGTNF